MPFTCVFIRHMVESCESIYRSDFIGQDQSQIHTGYIDYKAVQVYDEVSYAVNAHVMSFVLFEKKYV